MSIVGLISAAPSGRIGRSLSAMPDGGAGALSGLRAISPLAKNVHHFSLFVHVFVTYSIVFFYLCLNFFLRYLWLSPAFSAVRFSVRDINRSDMQHFVRNFSQSAQTLITKCCEI
ncbi:hypothetical protein ACMFAW_17265 [Citrobacter koseri]|uniref:hypothetical protein n=1 Tax=Citrobacter koseri TaxID=545 RepID=UPI003CEB77DE